MFNQDLPKLGLFQIVSVPLVCLIGLSILSTVALAAPSLQFYRIDVDIDDTNNVNVGLIMTFKEPEKQFSFDVLGRVENFNASSNSGPVYCQVDVSGTSTIKCNMNLTETHKELQLKFDTSDFVKPLDSKFYLSADLTPNVGADSVSATFKLPQNFLLVGENISSSILSYTENATAHFSGSRIIIAWYLFDIKSSEKLKFELLYEQVKEPFWFNLRMRHFVLFGAVFAVVLGFVVVRYLRRSEKLVLSVLDEYERQIMSIINKEGEVKQRRVVQLTNLSKAKVSRVVKSLANRGLIEVERTGRTNKIRISKKKFEP